MPRRFRAVLLSMTLIASLTAAGGAEQFDVRVLLATVGIALTTMAAQHLWKRDQARERWENRTDSALWGPEDGNGKRNIEAGVVAGVARLETNVDAILSRMDVLAKAAQIVEAFAADQAATLAERRRSRE